MAGLAVALAGCARENPNLSAVELFEKALDYESGADYENAVKTYNEIQSNHPFGLYAQQSLLNLAHLEYKEGNFDLAVDNADRFISEYPAHGSLDYARYLRAISLQRSKKSFFDTLILANAQNQERGDMVAAYDAFKELVEQHPYSSYTPDALERIGTIVEQLANDELQTSLHYFRIGAYTAAVRRATNLILTYPDSSVTEQAMAIMLASFVEIDASEPRADARKTLLNNFPESPYLDPAEQGADSLLAFMAIDKQPGDLFTKLIE